MVCHARQAVRNSATVDASEYTVMRTHHHPASDSNGLEATGLASRQCIALALVNLHAGCLEGMAPIELGGSWVFDQREQVGVWRVLAVSSYETASCMTRVERATSHPRHGLPGEIRFSRGRSSGGRSISLHGKDQHATEQWLPARRGEPTSIEEEVRCHNEYREGDDGGDPFSRGRLVLGAILY